MYIVNNSIFLGRITITIIYVFFSKLNLIYSYPYDDSILKLYLQKICLEKLTILFFREK